MYSVEHGKRQKIQEPSQGRVRASNGDYSAFLDSLAAQLKVTDAEIEAWAQANHPKFLANKDLVKRLYLILCKGVRFAAPFQPEELKSINQLVVGEVADIQVVVEQELSTPSYIGCPNDSKKYLMQ